MKSSAMFLTLFVAGIVLQSIDAFAYSMNDPFGRYKNGYVFVKQTMGQVAKLKDGVLRFTLGENKGREDYDIEVPVYNGHFDLPPQMPTGVYQVELVKPLRCRGFITDRWIYPQPSNNHVFVVNCNDCLWDVSITIRVEDKKTGFTTYRGSASWDDMPLQTLDSTKCHGEIPFVYTDRNQGKVKVYNFDEGPSTVGGDAIAEMTWFNLLQLSEHPSTPFYLQFQMEFPPLEGEHENFVVKILNQCHNPATNLKRCYRRTFLKKLRHRQPLRLQIHDMDSSRKHKVTLEAQFYPVLD